MRAKLITDNTITVLVDGVPYSIERSHPQAALVLAVVNNPDSSDDDIVAVFDRLKAVVNYMGGSIRVENDTAFYKDCEVGKAVIDRILGFMKEGLDYQPLLRFLDRLIANPSRRAVHELYSFLEYGNLPITDRGTILMYKAVRSDWFSVTAGIEENVLQGVCRNGHIRNMVGETIEVRRNSVDDDADRGCSYGLHAGTIEYVKGFCPRPDGHMLIVEVDPADVVSVPKDCGCQKVRCCKYTILGEYKCDLSDTYASTDAEGDGFWGDYDEDEDEDEDDMRTESEEAHDLISNAGGGVRITTVDGKTAIIIDE